MLLLKQSRPSNVGMNVVPMHIAGLCYMHSTAEALSKCRYFGICTLLCSLCMEVRTQVVTEVHGEQQRMHMALSPVRGH